MDDGFDYNTEKTPNAFVQYKGTDICMDFYCECGAHCHFDGYFANCVKCPHCETEWEMPHTLFPRRRQPDYGGPDPRVMEPDEDFTPEECSPSGSPP